MGRKGVSKRKPKRSNSGSNDNINHGSANARPGESPSSVQSLVNTRNAPLNRGGSNPTAGSNKKNRQGR
jgi:hypothetical protein